MLNCQCPLFLLWSIEAGAKEEISRKKAEYFETVIIWNSSYWKFRNKLRLLVGEKFSDQFLEYGDIFERETPACLHYKFVDAHRAVMEAMQNPACGEEAQIKVAELNIFCSVLLERITTEFLKRASSLDLLNVPEGLGGAEIKHKEPFLVIRESS